MQNISGMFQHTHPQGHLQGSSSSSVPSGTLRGCLSGRIRGGQGQREPQGAAESSMHLPGCWGPRFRALVWDYPHCPFKNIPFAAIKVILMTIIKVIYGARCSVCPAVAHVIITVYTECHCPHVPCGLPTFPASFPQILTLSPSHNDRQKHGWLVCVCVWGGVHGFCWSHLAQTLLEGSNNSAGLGSFQFIKSRMRLGGP